MTHQPWFKRVAIVGGLGFLLPPLLLEFGAPLLIDGTDGPDGLSVYFSLGLILVAIWGVTALYLLLFTIMHFRKSGN